MQEIKVAIDSARLEEATKPLAHFTVKAKLLKQRIRGANMALLVFGAVFLKQLIVPKSP